MFQGLRLRIGNYMLRRVISEFRHSPALVTLSQAKKIAFLFDAKNDQSVLEVKKLLKYFLKLNIDVDVLGFVNSRKRGIDHISTLHINYFSLEDVDVFGIPKSRKTNSFINSRYDFLINLSLDNSFATKCLALLSKSKYRIGVYSSDSDLSYDLMFNLKIKSLSFFAKNLIHYLELIDKNNEE